MRSKTISLLALSFVWLRAARAKASQVLQQRFGVHEVRRCETLGERVIGGSERGAGLVAAALPLPGPGETHRSPQLPCLALLALGCLDGLAEAGLRSGGIVG